VCSAPDPLIASLPIGVGCPQLGQLFAPGGSGALQFAQRGTGAIRADIRLATRRFWRSPTIGPTPRSKCSAGGNLRGFGGGAVGICRRCRRRRTPLGRSPCESASFHPRVTPGPEPRHAVGRTSSREIAGRPCRILISVGLKKSAKLAAPIGGPALRSPVDQGGCRWPGMGESASLRGLAGRAGSRGFLSPSRRNL
jgi:hypothetical protein